MVYVLRGCLRCFDFCGTLLPPFFYQWTKTSEFQSTGTSNNKPNSIGSYSSHNGNTLKMRISSFEGSSSGPRGSKNYTLLLLLLLVFRLWAVSSGKEGLLLRLHMQKAKADAVQLEQQIKSPLLLRALGYSLPPQ